MNSGNSEVYNFDVLLALICRNLDNASNVNREKVDSVLSDIGDQYKNLSIESYSKTVSPNKDWILNVNFSHDVKIKATSYSLFLFSSDYDISERLFRRSESDDKLVDFFTDVESWVSDNIGCKLIKNRPRMRV